jgi:micrococcal nuclease
VATVVSVVDGDTIKVVIGGKRSSLRYIGIDSPESGAHLAAEASQANYALVMGETVTLIRDVSETDRYGRLLRYVVAGGTFVNLELVRQGFASAYKYPPDTSCSSDFAAAQAVAVGAELGLWALPSPTAVRAIATTRAGNCDPSYPDVCIPRPPPDLDCGDIPYRRFRVLPPDPHHFDRDHDGIGCES